MVSGSLVLVSEKLFIADEFAVTAVLASSLRSIILAIDTLNDGGMISSLCSG